MDESMMVMIHRFHRQPLIDFLRLITINHRPVMVLSAGGVVALMNGPLVAMARPELQVFVAAFCIGVFGNVYAGLTASPALIVILNSVYMIGTTWSGGGGGVCNDEDSC